jgi:hypothetical protein
MKQPPSAEVYPSNLNMEALDVWVYVIRKYADLIFGSKSLGNQWFRACRIFEQACKSRNLSPYINNSCALYELAAKLRKLC